MKITRRWREWNVELVEFVCPCGMPTVARAEDVDSGDVTCCGGPWTTTTGNVDRVLEATMPASWLRNYRALVGC